MFYDKSHHGSLGTSISAQFLVPSGYPNAGNSCYMGVVFVLLASTKDFISALEGLLTQHIIRGGGDAAVIGVGNQVLSILSSVWSSQPCTARSIRKMKKLLKIDDSQQDASEFLEKLLEVITDSVGVKHHAFLGVLEGMLHTKTICRGCKKVPDPIFEYFLLQHVSGEANGNLANVLSPICEVLEKKNKYRCLGSKCFPQRQIADKTTELHTTSSNILFSIGRVNYGDDGVVLNEEIVLFQPSITLLDGSAFDLNGVVSHLGSTATSGHYVAYVKNPDSTPAGCWFLVNDDHVSVVDAQVVYRLGMESLAHERPLILQYVRRSV